CSTTTTPGTYPATTLSPGDPNNNPADRAFPTRRSTDLPAGPSITTTPDPTGGTVGATLNDSATVSGGFSPTGTVSFALYGPNNLTCSPTGAAPVRSEERRVGKEWASPSPGFTTTAAGTYPWTAHYSGDTNNNPADSACADEFVILGPAVRSIPVTPVPTCAIAGSTLNDSATVSGGFSPTGTVSFALYGPNNLTCSPTGAAPV